MSEDYEASIQALRDKNAQILDEKRAMKAKLTEATEQLEAVTAERDHSMSELRRITIDQPRAEMIEAATVPGMAETAVREINHHFDITDEGDITDKEGNPVSVDGVALKYDADGVKALYSSGLCPALGHMLKGSGSSGGGATGSRYRDDAGYSQPKKEEQPKRQYGLS